MNKRQFNRLNTLYHIIINNDNDLSIKSTISRKRVINICKNNELSIPQWLLCSDYINDNGYLYIKCLKDVLSTYNINYTDMDSKLNDYSGGHKYDLESYNIEFKDVIFEDDTFQPIKTKPVDQKENINEFNIPKRDKTFVSFGFATKLKSIIASREFFPVIISGLSGIGKTFIPIQICAKLKREIIVVSITQETSEDCLIGGFRLIAGETKWVDGPVVQAMKRGAILVLDEFDLGTAKIMCLQSILDGKGVFIKKTNEYITHEPGFNIIATGNTKGKGRWKGSYNWTNIINDAFLERFSVLFESDYPPKTQEIKILTNNYKASNRLSENIPEEDFIFIESIVEWATNIRTSFNSGDVTETISTRRLVHIIRAYSIFKSTKDALTLCLNRFNDENKTGFYDLFVSIFTINKDNHSDDPINQPPPLESLMLD